MNNVNELRSELLAVAKRSAGLMKACNNEQSTKLYLVLPMLGLLGYDATNPYEVYPDHVADAADFEGSLIDFAVLKEGLPVIAVACVKAGADPLQKIEQLARYFSAFPSTKLGVLSNGIVFEFFVDSVEPGKIDDESFLTVDLHTVALSGASDDVLEALLQLTKGNFDADTVAEQAHLRLVKKRLRTAFVEEAHAPAEDFCRFMMQRVGFHNVRKGAIDRHYASLIKMAFEEALVLPVVQRLKTSPAADAAGGAVNFHQLGQKIVATERELAIFNYIRRRLAYLVNDEELFAAIERVDFLDNVGKLIIFIDKDKRGRLLEFIRGDGFNKYVFPDPYGEIVTDNILDIDDALRATFVLRVRELGVPQGLSQKMARIA
jgi:hypothetical protein